MPPTGVAARAPRIAAWRNVWDDGGVKNFLSQQVRVISGAVCHEMFPILGDGTSGRLVLDRINLYALFREKENVRVRASASLASQQPVWPRCGSGPVNSAFSPDCQLVYYAQGV